MKKFYIVVILLFVVLICGCDNNSVVSDGKQVDVSNMEHKHCTREVVTEDGSDADISFELFYTDKTLKLLKSSEKIIIDDSDVLDEYENAYRKIDNNYVGLKYYDTKIKRTDNYVSHEIVINYDKIDTDKLLDIEGRDNSIIEDGKASVDKWLELAKKMGIKCHIVYEDEEV